MVDQVKIGNFLKELRKENGKTQEEIAEILLERYVYGRCYQCQIS